ncbi:MAG: hypothetical protein SPD54_03380 [Parabacteroides sp.]|nr:hypothetical protein [Parabacteroides sp.]
MEKLRQFIQDHQAEFDDEPLLEGHFERFEQKLATVQPKRSGRQVWLWRAVGGISAVAAVIALLLWLQPMRIVTDPSDGMVQEDWLAMQQEFLETQGYYQMRIIDLTEQMDKLCKEKRSTEAEQLLQAAWQVRSEVTEFEQEVVPTLSYDETGLYALTQTYSMGIGSLTFLLNQMETM